MQPEQEFVALALAGDLQAFQQLVEDNSSKLYRAAYRILNNKEQAEDCLQEAFIKTYLKMDSYNQPKQPNDNANGKGSGESVRTISENTLLANN